MNRYCIFFAEQTSCLTKQIRDTDPLLDQCWASVVDGGPTLDQQWVSVSCLLGGKPFIRKLKRLKLSIKKAATAISVYYWCRAGICIIIMNANLTNLICSRATWVRLKKKLTLPDVLCVVPFLGFKQ